MKQKPALIIAAGATVFMLVTAGGIVRIVSSQPKPAAASPSATVAAPASDATTQQYTKLIEEANKRIQTLKDENAALHKQLQTAQGSPVGAPAAGTISADDAAQAALNLAPSAQLMSTPALVNFRGVTAYEVVLDAGTVYVDASSGRPIYAISARQRNRQGAEQTQPAQPNDDDEHEEGASS
jgi:hypothetical protein